MGGGDACVVAGGERPVVQLGAEVTGVSVGSHLSRVVARAQETPGELVEAEGLGAGKLDRVVQWCAHRVIGQGGDDVVGRFGLNEGRRQPNGVALGAGIGDAADELEELGCADDLVGIGPAFTRSSCAGFARR